MLNFVVFSVIFSISLLISKTKALLHHPALNKCSHGHTNRYSFDTKIDIFKNLFSDVKNNKRVELNLCNNIDNQKFELPPFKIKDTNALLSEISFIFISQLVISIYNTVSSSSFPGWNAPISAEILYSPLLSHTFSVSFYLSLFWVLSRWQSGSLDMYFTSLKDIFDATITQWVAVANLYIVTSLIYCSINHSEVSGIEVPLLSGVIAIFMSRVLYYSIL